MSKKLALKIGVNVLIILCGLGFILYPLYTEKSYQAAQRHLARAAEKVKTSQAKNGKAAAVILPPGAVAQIVIPKIKLQAYVLEGTGAKILNQGPGHYEETPLPGEGGNSAIAAHRTMYGHPFRYLDRLSTGDDIIINTKKGRLLYQVFDVRVVKPTDLSVIKQDGVERLTLTTCNPVGSARQRLVVTAIPENG